MIENLDLITPENYSGEELIRFFKKRGWPVILVPVSEVVLVPTARGAALECSDGRFDEFPSREMHGPRVFGQINAIQAMCTGGDLDGLYDAWGLLQELGYTPGTHSAEKDGCKYHDLWAEGQFKHAIFDHAIKLQADVNIGHWLKQQMRLMGGKHFRLRGDHCEEAVRLNPFINTTECARGGNRFRVDDWLLAKIGIHGSLRWFHLAETVEKINPDAAKIEILYL